jgi:hypothetical protein
VILRAIDKVAPTWITNPVLLFGLGINEQSPVFAPATNGVAHCGISFSTTTIFNAMNDDQIFNDLGR